MAKRSKVIIMGAAGRDFHNFNVYFRSNQQYEVVAFTAAQIPGIEKRVYPPELTGPNYPNGIPIYPEKELPRLIKEHGVEQVILAYTDLLYDDVMHKASLVLANGADFRLMGPEATMLKSKRPVIAVCAVRTGSGKSTVTRRVADILRGRGLRVVVIRHPMPYGDLAKQICQRYTTLEDMDKYECTIEEREEYEPLIRKGILLYAGVDYEKVVKEAEKEADIIIWDGGNNDFPFYKPDFYIVVADPLRPGHELASYPGEVNARMADAFVINKVDTASKQDVETVERNLEAINPDAPIVKATSPVSVDKPELIRDKRVLVIEDGPTVTHGGLSYAAGYVAAKKFGAKEIVDPRPYAVGSLQETFEAYPHMKNVLPSMGYGKKQMREIEETVNVADCDSVIFGTPTDLRNFMKIEKPVVRVTYELEEINLPTLGNVLGSFLKKA